MTAPLGPDAGMDVRPRPALPEAPRTCPSCQHPMHVTTLTCTDCGTRIEGRFTLCRFCRLDPSTRQLLEGFLRARGNVRELQRELGVSYPTARTRLEQLWEQLGLDRETPAVGESAEEIVALLRTGQIDVGQAAERLRQRRG